MAESADAPRRDMTDHELDALLARVDRNLHAKLDEALDLEHGHAEIAEEDAETLDETARRP